MSKRIKINEKSDKKEEEKEPEALTSIWFSA